MEQTKRARRQSYLRRQRSAIAKQLEEEFTICLKDARELIPDRAKDDCFESIIHALWWDLRGDVPDEWWDEAILRDAYESFIDINSWWLAQSVSPLELNDSCTQGVAELLVSALMHYSPPVEENE